MTVKKITPSSIELAVAVHVFIEGFIVIKENHLRINRKGRKYIEDLAEIATAPLFSAV